MKSDLEILETNDKNEEDAPALESIKTSLDVILTIQTQIEEEEELKKEATNMTATQIMSDISMISKNLPHDVDTT